MKGKSSRALLRQSFEGQAALILIMIMAIVGTVSVGVASTAVENLRTQEIENVSGQAFRAADAGLELALSTKSNVSETQLGGSGNVTYQATYVLTGSDGFIADSVDEGDVVQVSLEGATGITAINIYWNSNSAVKASLFKGDRTAGSYSVTYYTGDPNGARRVTNKFSASSSGGSFKGVSFNNVLSIPINMAGSPPPVSLRATVLYSGSTIGIEPVGGAFASDPIVSATGTGKVQPEGENLIVTSLSFTKFSERVPTVFDNVLYSNGSIIQ